MLEEIKKAAKLVKGAIDKKTPFYLFGDGDTDGAVSVLVFEESLKKLGVEKIETFFANRKEFGFGFNEAHWEVLKKKPKGILLVFDSNFVSAELSQKVHRGGFVSLVLDHHITSKHFASIDIFLNLQLLPEDNQFRSVCGAGLSFLLAQEVFREMGHTFPASNLIDLVFLATIADKVPEEGFNKELLQEGLEILPYSGRPAIEALFSVAQENPLEVSRREIEFNVLPVLSGVDNRGMENNVYRFLKMSSYNNALAVAKLFSRRRELNRSLLEVIIKEVEKKISLNDPIIFAGSADWPIFLAARAASVLAQKYNRPAFIFQRGESVSQASGRSVPEFNIIDILSNCRSLFVNWGGHAQAAGFGFLNEKEEKVRECLYKSFKKIEKNEQGKNNSAN